MSEALLSWYDQNKRSLPWRDDPSPYHVWISEIMLQQTRVEAVKGYYERFLARFPDVRTLAEAPQDECLKLWEGLGYYSRARNLQRAARQIMGEYEGQIPHTAGDLQKLSGIGSYTAAAIASISFGEKIPAVDGNLLRIFSRIALYEEEIRTPQAAKEAARFFLAQMPDERPGDFNQALMDLGASLCTPKEPACTRKAYGGSWFHSASAAYTAGPSAGGGSSSGGPGVSASVLSAADMDGPEASGLCPLQPFCQAHSKCRCRDLPVMPAKKPRSIEKRTVLVIRDNERVLLRKRPPRGLLAGLYEFPNEEGWLTRREAIEKARALGCDPVHVRRLPDAKHIFTHKEWHMRGYEIRTGGFSDVQEKKSDKAAVFFVSVRQLQMEYAVPGAFAAYTPC